MINPETGHLRFQPVPNQALLEEYYNGQFSSSHEAPSVENEFTQHVIEIFRGVDKYLQIHGNLGRTYRFHDIGCGYGAAVWAMQQLGHNASGNEANRHWVEEANPHCKGRLTYAPLSEYLNTLTERVDVFFSAHVLEHLADPRRCLETVAKHLSDEGLVYICVPNIQSKVTRDYGVRNPARDTSYNFPMHLNYFTPYSLFLMLESVGLEGIQVETRSMFGDEATPDECKALLGWELFMLAAKPGNQNAIRDENTKSRCKAAYHSFQATAIKDERFRMRKDVEYI